MRRQRFVLAVTLVIAVAIAVLVSLLVRARTISPEGEDVAAPATATHPSPILHGLNASSPPASQWSGLRLTLIDVGTGLPAPSLQVEVKGIAGSQAWQMISSSPEGFIDVETEASAELRSPDDSWRLLTIETSSTMTASGPRTVRAWIARVLRVRATVSFEELPPPSQAPYLTLTSACILRSPGAMDSADKDPGTHAWLAKHAPADLFHQVQTRKNPMEYLQLALQEVAVIVGAPGYAPATQIIDFSAFRGNEADVAFLLRPVNNVTVRVSDPDGKPLEKAHVQLIEDREGSPLDVNIYVEAALQRNRGQGYTVYHTNESARVSHLTGGETSASGSASLPSSGGATRRYLVVWAANHLPYLSRETDDLFREARNIVLEPMTPLRASYRFTHDGDPIHGGMLNLAEALDGLTPALPTILAHKDGSFPASLIVPGKEYYAVVHSRTGGSPHEGWLEFGSEEIIDTNTMRPERAR